MEGGKEGKRERRMEEGMRMRGGAPDASASNGGTSFSVSGAPVHSFQRTDSRC